MSSQAAMTMPGGRVVLGWWTDLAGLAPRRLWFGHLILHVVEALVEVTATRPLEPLARVLLPWLARRDSPIPLPQLATDLTLDPTLVHSVLADLARRGQAEEVPGGWRITQATENRGEDTTTQRWAFVFSDDRPPVFLPLAIAATQPLAPLPGWRFDLSTLQKCLDESPEWKQQRGFPPEVLRLLPLDTDWRAVPVDQPAQALLLFVEVPTGLLAFAVRSDTWTYNPDPVLRIPAGSDLLDALGADPGIGAWRQAWQAWCQQRSLPGAEVEGCKLEPTDHRLVVRAPGKLLERLRSNRSDALKGEAWLLAGAGRVRPAAMVDIVEG